MIIIATGSEVDLAINSKEALKESGISARVVSMPCTQAFDRQDTKYKDSVLTPGIKRVSIEAGITDYWKKYVGLDGASVGIDTYGESSGLFSHRHATHAALPDAGRQISVIGLAQNPTPKMT